MTQEAAETVNDRFEENEAADAYQMFDNSLLTEKKKSVLTSLSVSPILFF